MSGEASATPVQQVTGCRVGWLELLFDLAFVAFITEAAHSLYGAPGLTTFLLFLAFSFPAWWAWSNLMVTVNLVPTLPARPLGVALLAAMGIALVMAASVSEGTRHIAAFALACAGLRVIMLALWVRRVRRQGFPILRPVVYNGVTAVLWAASSLMPAPWIFAVWGCALVIEFLLLRTGDRRISRASQIDVAHGSERLGLFMIILFGESVLSIVTSLGAHWSVSSAVAALLGFLTIAVLAWRFFVAGDGVIERGLARLNGAHDLAGLLDTVLFLPYLFVVGVPLFAAGLYTAVTQPSRPLSFGAAICLCGGLALFELGHSVIPLRYGTAPRIVLVWAVPGVLLPIAALPLATELSALASVALVTGIVIVVFAIASADRRLRARLAARR
jgi:Predicted membrane protein